MKRQEKCPGVLKSSKASGGHHVMAGGGIKYFHLLNLIQARLILAIMTPAGTVGSRFKVFIDLVTDFVKWI